MPREFGANAASASGFIRMPIPPDSYAHHEAASPTGTLPMKAEIYSVGGALSDASGPSPMAEVVDNHALDINPYNLTETVSRSKQAASSLDAAKSQQGEPTMTGVVKGLWNLMFEEPVGSKQNPNTLSK